MKNSFSSNFCLPEHPLPEEIQKMSRSETVCKFCGISYLIHNEVKSLQEKLANAEREILHYKESGLREKQLKQELENMETSVKEQRYKVEEQKRELAFLNSDLEIKARTINELHEKKHFQDDYIEEQKEQTNRLLTKITRLSNLPNLCIVAVKKQKEVLQTLRENIVKEHGFFKKILADFGNELKKFTTSVKDNAVIERDSMVLKYNSMEKQCMDLQHKLKNMEGAEKKLLQTKTEFAVVEKKMDEYERRVTQFEHENKLLQEKNELLQRNIGFVQMSSSEQLKISMEKHQKQQEAHEKILTEKNEEIEKLISFCKSLERQVNEKSATEARKTVKKDAELQNVKDKVEELTNLCESLQSERERMIIAHHDRIDDLRKSYGRKLETSEISCRDLEKQLEKQNEVENESATLRSSLIEADKKIAAIRTDYSKEVDMLNVEINNLKETLKEKSNVLLSLKDENNNITMKLSLINVKKSEETRLLQLQILDLNKKIENFQRKERDKDKSFDAVKFEKLVDIKMLKEKLSEKEDQVVLLQETVRRECEERLELTQALSDIRVRFLALQQNFDLSRSKIRNKVKDHYDRSSVLTVSSDISSRLQVEDIDENKRSTKMSVDNLRDRIAAALGRESSSNHSR